MKKILAWSLWFLAASCLTRQEFFSARTTPAVHLTLVGTNDMHGWLSTQEVAFPRGKIRYGGAAILAAYLKVLREDNPDGVILVDAGDLFQGTLISNMSEGEVVVDVFNQLHYDAAAIGNHEFDYGPLGPSSTAHTTSGDPFGALKARIAQAKFPWLSANIFEAKTNRRPKWLHGDGSIIIEKSGIKVGIFGLTTPQTSTITTPLNVASLRFDALAKSAREAAARLRDRGADLVLAVVHAGGHCGDVSNAFDATFCDLDLGEVFQMLDALPKGTLDAVVAGHTHDQIGHFIKGTPIIESFAYGRYFGIIELFVDPKTKKVLPKKTVIQSGIELCATVDKALQTCNPRRLRALKRAVKPVPARFRGRTIAADPSIQAFLSVAEQRVAKLKNRDLNLRASKSLRRNYAGESELGSLLADALRASTNADVALLNPGGLRADMLAGNITYGTMYQIMPFDNQVATLQLNGEQLLRLLSTAYGAQKGVFQISGLEIQLGRCPSENRLKIVTLHGKPLDPFEKLKVVMPDFLARGGDGLISVIQSIPPAHIDLKGSMLRDELIAYWQAHNVPLRAPPPGRIAFVDTGDECSHASKNKRTSEP